MIACIHVSGVLPAFTLTPNQRQLDGVNGLTTNHLVRYISNTLGPAVANIRQTVMIEDVLYIPTNVCRRSTTLC